VVVLDLAVKESWPPAEAGHDGVSTWAGCLFCWSPGEKEDRMDLRRSRPARSERWMAALEVSNHGKV
jgi:hypothetical protein